MTVETRHPRLTSSFILPSVVLLAVRHSLFSSIAVLCIYLLSLPNAHAAPVVFDIVGATDGTVSVTGSFAFDSTASYSNLNIMLSGIANESDDNTTYTSFFFGDASMVSAADNASPEDNILLEFDSNISSISPTAVGLKLVQLNDTDEEASQILLQNTGSVVPRAVPAPLVGLGIPAFLAVGAGLLGAQLTRFKR